MLADFLNFTTLIPAEQEKIVDGFRDLALLLDHVVHLITDSQNLDEMHSWLFSVSDGRELVESLDIFRAKAVGVQND